MNVFSLMHKRRKAIAMIELIFAIVIMGIVMLSAPMLIDRSTASTYVALQQESIAAAAAQINMIMTANWDHSDTNITQGSPVLQTGSTSTKITNWCATREYPIGVTSISGRHCYRSDIDFPSSANALGTDGSEGAFYDDIDDYHNKDYIISVYEGETYATHQGDYLDRNITIESKVYYGDDTPRNATDTAGDYAETTTFSNPFRHTITANTTNIKLITVTLTSSNPVDEISDKQMMLSAFMCNIGAPRPQLYSNKSSL